MRRSHMVNLKILGELGLHGIEQADLDDAGMFAGIAIPMMIDLADIGSVLEQVRQRSFGEGYAANGATSA